MSDGGAGGRGCGFVLAVLRGSVLLVADALVDFFAMDADFLRREHPDSHLAALDAEDRHRDVVTDHQCFADATRQDQHSGIPPPKRFLVNAKKMIAHALKGVDYVK